LLEHSGVVSLTETNVGDEVVGFQVVGLDDEGVRVVGLAEVGFDEGVRVVGFVDVGKLVLTGFAGLKVGILIGVDVVGESDGLDEGVLVLGVYVVGELLLIGRAVVGE